MCGRKVKLINIIILKEMVATRNEIKIFKKTSILRAKK